MDGSLRSYRRWAGRWLAPVGAAAAVLALFVVPGLVATVGSGDGGPGPDNTPDGVLTPQDPVTPTLPPDDAEKERTGPRDVEVVGYRAQGRTLRIYYRVDQSTDCSAQIEKPMLTERAGAVVVSLRRRPAPSPVDVCVNLLLTNSVDLELSRPLGGRVVLDASRGGSLVPIEPPYRSDALVTPPNGRAGR